jgi:putative ABC transport system permease protein
VSLWLTFRIAWRALAKNKLRAGLTVLGVVIGVAAVTAMVSIGQSASDMVRRELQGIGTNAIIVLAGSDQRGGVRGGRGSIPTLTAEDAVAVGRECPSLLAVSPIVGAREQVIYGNTNWSPREILGVTKDFLVVRNWQVGAGGFFTDRDVIAANKVCVIGRTIVEKLFQTTNPLGRQIRIKNIPFRVIGVLQAKGANLVGDDQDDIVLAPYTTVRSRLRGSHFDKIDVIFAAARSSQRMDQAEYEIRQLLMERHRIRHGDPPDFEVHTTTEIANMFSKIMGTMTALLSAIAGISLLVGGVGIMNIMLVSVTERTREIGIRLAVGARQRDILRQFLVEALLLSLFGGIIGLALGTGASLGITAVINSIPSGTAWPLVISWKAAALAIGFASLVGVFFGYYPARRASRLDPIEALRYE